MYNVVICKRNVTVFLIDSWRGLTLSLFLSRVVALFCDINAVDLVSKRGRKERERESGESERREKKDDSQKLARCAHYQLLANTMVTFHKLTLSSVLQQNDRLYYTLLFFLYLQVVSKYVYKSLLLNS